MNSFIKKFFIISLLILPVFCFAENEKVSKSQAGTHIRTIDRENYQVQIKQYDKSYPIVLYVVFKDSTPPLDKIKKILKTEILTYTKVTPTDNIIIASAWFDDQVSDNLEKIELSSTYGAFVRIYDKKNKKDLGIKPFSEYLQYLRKNKKAIRRQN